MRNWLHHLGLWACLPAVSDHPYLRKLPDRNTAHYRAHHLRHPGSSLTAVPRQFKEPANHKGCAMRCRTFALCAAVTVALSLLVAPAAAVADPGLPAVDGGATDWMPQDGVLGLHGGAPSSGATALATYPSPSYCRGQSNYPHQSTTSGSYGWIKGYSQTYCVANVPYIEVRATVWRKRWWGYEHVGTDGFGSTTWWYSIGRSGTYAGCQTNRWRTVGYHKVKDVDAQWYSLETQSYNDITCW